MRELTDWQGKVLAAVDDEWATAWAIAITFHGTGGMIRLGRGSLLAVRNTLNALVRYGYVERDVEARVVFGIEGSMLVEAMLAGQTRNVYRRVRRTEGDHAGC